MPGPLSPADVAELTDVNVRYTRALDLEEPDLLRAVFTADMVLEFHPLGDEPSIRYQGLGSFLSRPSVLFRTQHFLSNCEFEVAADGACGHSYVLGVHWIPASPGEKYLVGAKYSDRYHGGLGHWRIAERQCYFLCTHGDPAVMTGTVG